MLGLMFMVVVGGALVLKSNGQFATDGALRDLDSNADGLFNSTDAKYANLRLWRDLNQNGLADARELQGLAALGIETLRRVDLPRHAANAFAFRSAV
jgi:hypothetical protein